MCFHSLLSVHACNLFWHHILYIALYANFFPPTLRLLTFLNAIKMFSQTNLVLVNATFIYAL